MAERNDALAGLIQEAGYSEAGLARRVNQLSCGACSYDYTAVYRWVKKGQRPRGDVPRMIAEALSERLNRRVVPADFGMNGDAGTIAERSLAYPPEPLDTVDTVVELGRADVKRRTLVTKSPYLVAALAIPSRDWLLATLKGR
ncbi:MAG: hypothetical protein ACRDJ9_12680 [Dehalococcoidia bacterium]